MQIRNTTHLLIFIATFGLSSSFTLARHHAPPAHRTQHLQPGFLGLLGARSSHGKEGARAEPEPLQRHRDASGMSMPKLGFVFSRSASVIPALMAGLTGAAAGMVQLADVVDAPNAALRTFSLAAVPACDEMNVGLATRQILAHLWTHRLGN